MIDPLKIGFFGSSKVSIYVLDELKKAGLIPSLIITTPDRPQGRGMKMAPNVVKAWAAENDVRALDPERLDEGFEGVLKKEACDFFIVASYGKIMPAGIVDMPKHKTLNVHPSLLPGYRGAAPLPTTMLDDAKETGVTIMRMDEKMDHGPIVAKKEITVAEWPTYEVFEEMMAREGGKLLADCIPAWIAGTIKEIEQDHAKATFTKKIKKEDGLLDLAADPYMNFRKIQAYHEWPQAYFFAEKGGKKIRVKVAAASFRGGELQIERVIPEGGREMGFSDFLKGYRMI